MVALNDSSPDVLGIVKHLLGTHRTYPWDALVAVYGVSCDDLGPEPVVGLLRGHVDLHVAVVEAAGNLFHVLVGTDQDKVRGVQVALKAQGVVGLQLRVANHPVVGTTPVKEALVAHRLALGALALVVGIQLLAEVAAVGEVEGDVVCVEAALQDLDLAVERADDLVEVGGNRDEVFAPVQLCLVGGAGPVCVEVRVDAELGASDSPPNWSLAGLLPRGGL